MIPELESKFVNVSRWLFWVLIAVIVTTIGIGSFYLYQYSKGRELTLSLKAPSEMLLGVPFDIEVNFANGSDQPIEDVELSMVLPENVISTKTPDKRILTENFGILGANSSFQTKIPVAVFGKPDSIQRFRVAVSYLPSSIGPKARFEKTGTVDVAIREPAITLDLAAPQKVLSNENFEIKIDYKNIADFKFSDVNLELSLPPTFSFKSATPKPTQGNNIWTIGELDKGAGGTITISGNISAVEQSFFEIKAVVKIKNYLLNEKSANVNIAASPLSVSVSVNGQSSYIARTDDTLRYAISYRNNSDIGLNDVVIKAKLTGEMFNFQTLSSRGYFDSRSNTLTWNTANTPELRVLAPGASGSVEFEIHTKDNYPIKRLADKNFVLKVDAEISSPTVPYYVAADKTASATHFETKVSGRVVIDAKAFYRDTASGIKNSGPIPPKVNSPTTFTIHWLIYNYATDVKNIEVKTTLPAGIRITNIAPKSNVGSLPTFNERTGEVSWTVEQIMATKGVLGDPVEAIFQIEATPNIIQVGQPMPILNETMLKAIDTFTNIELIGSDTGLTTQLADDPTIGQDQGAVIQ
jgi:hypothetical protein